MDSDSREVAQSYFWRMSVSAGGEGVVFVPDDSPSSGGIYLVQGKEVRSPWEREYARFGLESEELEKQDWLEPVESIRGWGRPKNLKIPLLVLDMDKVKSKDIGERCTLIGRCQRWSLLEWARMNPRDLSKFFTRMEKDVGFQRFYGGLYDAMHLCYRSIVDEKAPAVEDTEKRLKAAVLHSLEEESEGLRKCEEELKVRRMRFLLYPLPR